MAIKNKKKTTRTKETYRQGLLLGMGLASLSKKAAGSYINKLVKDNKLSTKEGEKLAKDLLGKTSKVSKQVAKTVQQEVKTRLSAGLSLSRQGLKTLDATLSAIEKQLSPIKKKAVKTKKR